MSKRFFSRKYPKILAYNAILEAIPQSTNSQDKLIIHTANGVYQGVLKEPLELSNLDLNKCDDILTSIRKLYLSQIEQYYNSKESENSVEITENPISIELENVDLFTSMRSIHMPFVSIFIDQIVGISIGHIE